MFVSAAVHGDEIIGVEIVRRLARQIGRRRIAGTLLLIPIVNSFGFISQSRYLPDRRDLNRSFPGNAKGSLAGRLAHLFLNEVVRRSDCGIDIHSAAAHRTNLPQIRLDFRDQAARKMAEAFRAPVIVNSPLRDGSLRFAAAKEDIPILVFEAGEALRFDEFAIRVGVKGVLSVMADLGMISSNRLRTDGLRSLAARGSSWVRATAGGVMRATRKSGDVVEEGELLGVISDPFGERESEILATKGGLIIGRTNLPVVNEGDALFHVAQLPKVIPEGTTVEALEEEFQGDPLFDEDEIY